MKKTLILLAIGLTAAALVDVTFAFSNHTISIVTAALVFFLSGYVFYNRIMENPIINSILVFLFLDAMVSYEFTVNKGASHLWGAVSITAILGYATGIVARRIIAGKSKPIDTV